jgi:hypothetical protein
MSVMTKGQGSLLARGGDGESLPLMFRRRETRVIEVTPDASTRLVQPLGADVGVVTLVATGALWFNQGGATVAANDPLIDGESGFLAAGGSIDLPLRNTERYLAARALDTDARLYLMVRG